ncbi:MAG: hypothetical protein K6E98_01495 [Lachnospiraceae bacterium]|nr:hypothetical protein [Lachnospiraceae bacterium]
MINMVGVEYVLPPPPVPPDIPAVAASVPFMKYSQNGRRDAETEKKKKNPLFNDILKKKEEKEEIGQMGCFFEAKV